MFLKVLLRLRIAKLEATKCTSESERLNKLQYIIKLEDYSVKNQNNIDLCNNMDESKVDFKMKEARTKGSILCDSIHITWGWKKAE